MKKSLLTLAIMALTLIPVMAQSIDDYIEIARDVLNTEKKAAVAEAMQLADSESGPFWDLYNEYQAALYKVHTKRVNVIKDYAANFENLTDEKADDLWTQSLAYQSELLKLEKAWYKKFKKILPSGKAARYFQIENKIDALISAELAAEIPLIETN